MKLITDGPELDEIVNWMTRAAQIAPLSKCTKTSRGVIIVRGKEKLSVGYIYHSNPDKYCNPCVRLQIRDNTNRELCGAEHAEAMAIRVAKDNDIDLTGSRLYHMKVKNGQMAPSGPPSCALCSDKMLKSGISEAVIWHKEGYALYDIKEFDELSKGYTP